MTEFEKELVRFVSGYLDAGVSAENYVKAFSQRLLNSIGKQSKPEVSEDLEEDENIFANKDLNGEVRKFIEQEKKENHGDLPCYGDFGIQMIARHFAQWGAEHLKK